MHLQVLASGSAGNATLLRHDDTSVLVDAGLPLRGLLARLNDARFAPQRLDHVLLTHGHLDHARSAGALARRCGARVHCAGALMRNRSLAGAREVVTLPVNGETLLFDSRGSSAVRVDTVALSHDADPTVGLRVEAGGRVAVVLTDLGRVEPGVADRLGDAHVLVLEFNHDLELLERSPYPPRLRARIRGDRGHLSNDQAAAALDALASDTLHTLVLAHLSRTNNTPERALDAARHALARLGREDVRVLVAEQDAIGPNLSV